MHTRMSGLGNQKPLLEFATGARTRLAIAVHELSAVLNPLVHNIICRVEDGKPPFVGQLLPRTIDHDLVVVGCNGDRNYGDN